ncbi:hypothetical protein C5Y96_05495 [Blastopirellula marina]|uniref:DUF4064 domain-containing protein n=1 Tax=Blastopirellula marina TaxID=124 RepID=A0A2S8G4D6_9BACT|nr:MULTISPECIES: hypothetical protein [Pirellulaceae]PQO39308.1 hypothetical protein C5Y96_05495 [Blastopirellula marina]RCS55616.1 hypothetical protein DTL36_05505 [Bremerella cremea]
MSNPYESPSNSPQSSAAQSAVTAPAIALMVISALAVVVGILGLMGDAFLLLSGAVEQLEEMNDGPVSKYQSITVRIIWGIALILASAYIFYGAMQMKQLTNYTAARTAAMISVIPCLGPCCFLGIPFGIWALVVLSKPEMRDAFR